MISTTIKKEFMDKILSGEKTVEYRAFTKYWQRYIGGYDDVPLRFHKTIKFLCGRKVYEYSINDILLQPTPVGLIDILGTSWCYHIHLGERVGD